MDTLLSLIAPRAYALNPNDLLLKGTMDASHGNTGVTFRDYFLPTVEQYLIGAVFIVAIGMILYLGMKLLMAEGNSDKHKKVWSAVAHLAIGLALIPLAYVIVRILAGLNI